MTDVASKRNAAARKAHRTMAFERGVKVGREQASKEIRREHDPEQMDDSDRAKFTLTAMKLRAVRHKLIGHMVEFKGAVMRENSLIDISEMLRIFDNIAGEVDSGRKIVGELVPY